MRLNHTQSLNKKILVICPHPVNSAPGQRLKYEQYFEAFKKANYTVEVSSFMTMRFWDIVYKRGYLLEKIFWTIIGYFLRVRDLFRLRNYDVIYIFLWVTPFGKPLFEWLYNKANNQILYDIDDMVFLGHSSSANKFIEGIKGKEKMIFLMKKAKHVIVCTPKLAEYVSQYNKELTDISSTINTETYKGKNLYNNQNPLTIGWSGSHSTSKYLRLITDILKELQEQYKIKILVIGDASFTAPGLEIESINWNAATEVENLQRIDIGVYPLPNEDWVYGKSGLKALQYMALGIPTVATAIGANFRIIENEETGFLVNTKEEWKEKLELLCNNPELRKKIGMAAALKVEKEYSIKANAPLYLDALKKVTSV